MKIFSLFVLGILISLLVIKTLPAAFMWVGVTWSIVFLLIFKVAKKDLVKTIVMNLSIFAFIFAGLEFYLWAPFTEKVTSSGDMWNSKYYVRHSLIGYSPLPNVQAAKGKKYYGKQIIYDMSYSTDANGLRVTYPRSVDNKNSVLFFGCSITFGDGVNDHQTLAYEVGRLGKEIINTYNFGYSGYGPHQMLASIENGLISKALSDKPKYAIYSAIPGHVLRSAGLQSWIVTRHDPRYEIDKNGELFFAGHFDDDDSVRPNLRTRIYAILSNSFVLKKLYKPFAYNQKRIQNEYDLNRYIKIVVRARDLFESQYPGSEFHVLFWNLKDVFNNDEVIDKILTAFAENNIRIHMIKDILPGYYQNNPYYQIAFDSHPTPYANNLLAEYVLTNIVHKAKA